MRTPWLSGCTTGGTGRWWWRRGWACPRPPHRTRPWTAFPSTGCVPEGPAVRLASWLALPFVFAALVRRSTSYDVIYCPDIRIVGIAAMAARYLLGKRLVVQPAVQGTLSCADLGRSVEAGRDKALWDARTRAQADRPAPVRERGRVCLRVAGDRARSTDPRCSAAPDLSISRTAYPSTSSGLHGRMNRGGSGASSVGRATGLSACSWADLPGRRESWTCLMRGGMSMRNGRSWCWWGPT